jgi:hypothetical protein
MTATYLLSIMYILVPEVDKILLRMLSVPVGNVIKLKGVGIGSSG